MFTAKQITRIAALAVAIAATWVLGAAYPQFKLAALACNFALTTTLGLLIFSYSRFR